MALAPNLWAEKPAEKTGEGRHICIPSIEAGVIGIEVSKTGRALWCTQARRGRQVVITHQQPMSDMLGHERRYPEESRKVGEGD